MYDEDAEKTATLILAACYLDDLSSDPYPAYARDLLRRRLITCDAATGMTTPTPDGEELLDVVMMAIYVEAPSSANTALLRALTLIHENMAAGYLEAREDYDGLLDLTETAQRELDRLLGVLTVEQVARIADPARVEF